MFDRNLMPHTSKLLLCLSDCVQDYVDLEAGNANSFMYINGDFYIKTPLHENGHGEDPVHYSSYVKESIQPIIDWLRSPLSSSSALNDVKIEEDSKIVSDDKRNANVPVSDSIQGGCSASRYVDGHENSSCSQTVDSNCNRGVGNSRSSSSMTAKPVVGKKRSGLSCFADQARLVLRKAEQVDAKTGKGPVRRVPLPDSSRNQALVEGM